MTTKYAGSEHIEGTYKCQLAPRIRDVMDVIGQAYAGIYHCPQYFWTKNLLETQRFVLVKEKATFSTYDNDLLTKLVVLCHDKAIRMEISVGQLWARYNFERDHHEYLPSNHPKIDGYDEAFSTWESAPEGEQLEEIEWYYAPSPRLDIYFHPRAREGNLCERHPSLEASVERIRNSIGLGAI